VRLASGRCSSQGAGATAPNRSRGEDPSGEASPTGRVAPGREPEPNHAYAEDVFAQARLNPFHECLRWLVPLRTCA
jgi:hypothetical protein